MVSPPLEHQCRTTLGCARSVDAGDVDCQPGARGRLGDGAVGEGRRRTDGDAGVGVDRALDPRSAGDEEIVAAEREPGVGQSLGLGADRQIAGHVEAVSRRRVPDPDLAVRQDLHRVEGHASFTGRPDSTS
jgi:hypothetical protein